MKETFNMTRFWLLVRRQWAENKKIYFLLWSLISLSIVFTTLAFDEKDYQVALYYWIFLLGGCGMILTLFSRWREFGLSSFYLLLPASSTEKYLCGLFYSLILFVPVFCLNFIFSRYILTYLLIMPFISNLGPVIPLIAHGIRESLSIPFNVFIFPLLSLLTLQSVLMVIVMSFRKNHALIYLITVLLVIIVYNLLMRPLMSDFGNIPKDTSFSPGIFFPHFNLGFGFNAKYGGKSEYFYFIRMIRYLNNMLCVVTCFLLYLAAAYRLKEREL